MLLCAHFRKVRLTSIKLSGGVISLRMFFHFNFIGVLIYLVAEYNLVHLLIKAYLLL